MAQKTIILKKIPTVDVKKFDPRGAPLHPQVCDWCGKPTKVSDEIMIEYFFICPTCYEELMK